MNLLFRITGLRTGEAGSAEGDLREINFVVELFVARVHVEDRDATLHIWYVHRNLPVKAARSHECRVEDVRPVGRCNDDDARVALKAVHLCEKLVKRLLTFIVAAADARAARPADSIDLIDKDEAGGVLLGLLEEVANSGCADANKHLNKLGTRDGEEGHSGLAGNRLGKQSLACRQAPCPYVATRLVYH